MDKKNTVSASNKETIQRLELLAEEKESIRTKLEVTAKSLSLKAKELAVIAREKESVRRKLAIVAKQLKSKATLLALTAKEKEAIRGKLAVTAKNLALVAKEKESVRRKLATVAKQLKSKAVLLAVIAREKEDVRSKLVITAKDLALVAKEKESIRGKLEITARQLATTAGEKEDTRRRLALTAKQLATTAKEKEGIEKELLVTVGELNFKAEEVAITLVKQEAILASIGDAVMACDKDGKVMLFNRKAVEVTGYSSKEIIGKHYSHLIEFIKESDETPIKDFIAEAMKTGQKTEMADNTLLIKKDGSKIPVADSAEPIRYNKGVLIGCVIVFRDVTKEKEIDKAKSEFISLTSHQLKTPTTIVSLYSEQLLNGHGGIITEKQKEYINEIRGANQRMIDIINALLNISRIEMGIFTMDLAPVDIIDFLKDVLKRHQLSFASKQIAIVEEYHSSAHLISTDKLMLNMVFSNLVANSMKYTPKGGRISIKSSEVKKGEEINKKILEDDGILVSVSDNGCGIPVNQQDKIFTKFFRSDNARIQHTDGTGLGLYIVKSILNHMGGDVWSSSKENEGTVFYFTFPSNKVKQKKDIG